MTKVVTRYRGDMLFETAMGGHDLLVDAPGELGGRGRGPEPPDLLLASLTSCIASLVADYCRDARLEAEGLRVEVECECRSSMGRLTDVRVVIALPGARCSGEHVKAMLARVAEWCPAHELLASLTDVEVRVLGPARDAERREPYHG